MNRVRHLFEWGLIALAAAVLITACGKGGQTNGEPPEKEKGKPAETQQTEAGKPQATCPVMGGKINKEIYADHEGKRVYFCCPACVDKFEKDPEQYIKKLQDAGVTLAQAPAEAEKAPAPEAPEKKGHEGHEHK
jgi:YHS domain-containing protein